MLKRSGCCTSSGLIKAVKIAKPAAIPAELSGLDLVAFTRKKVSPIVRGTSSKAEQEIVLAILENAVAFLTHDNIENLLTEVAFLSTALKLANIYLENIDSDLL